MALAVCKRLGHMDVRTLKNSLGDAERDPVDEVPLPQLERRRRRFLEAGEVGEVTTEGVPALGLDLGSC